MNKYGRWIIPPEKRIRWLFFRGYDPPPGITAKIHHRPYSEEYDPPPDIAMKNVSRLFSEMKKHLIKELTNHMPVSIIIRSVWQIAYTSKQGGVRKCLYAQKIKHPRPEEIKEEQTGRWLLRLSLNAPLVASLLCHIEYARTVGPTTSVRSLFRKKHKFIRALISF